MYMFVGCAVTIGAIFGYMLTEYGRQARGDDHATKSVGSDRSFLANMITSHESAVMMASLAQNQAGDNQIKQIARTIIANQNTVISEMQSMQSDWDYPPLPGDAMMNHTPTHDDMREQLIGLQGDVFNEKFSELMIKHLAATITEARTGSSTAEHQQLKPLAATIINNSTKDIAKLQAWEKMRLDERSEP